MALASSSSIQAPPPRRRRSATTCPGVNPAVQHGLQRREPLQRGIPQPLVARHRGASTGGLTLLSEHGRLDRADLAVEPALGPRLLGLLLRLKTELVDVLAGDSALLGDPLGGARTGWACRCPTSPPGSLPGRGRRWRRGRAAHRLDAAGDAESIAPVAISPAMRWLACWPLLHWQSTVVVLTSCGKPAVSHDTRVMSLDCSANCVTQPQMSCSTSPASIPAFSTSAF